MKYYHCRLICHLITVVTISNKIAFEALTCTFYIRFVGTAENKESAKAILEIFCLYHISLKSI